MKQLIQHLRTGETILEEIPTPALQPGHILIKTACTLISAGTEKMLVEFSKSSLISKARKNPDRVAQVLDKIKTDGLLPTLEAVFNRLEEPLPLGYCNAGTVVAVADDVTAFKTGDRVASNGMHAEYVTVPVHLAAQIPDNVSFEDAAFTVIASIGLQGIRLAQPQMGETIVVTGLGLIGLITCQLLRSNGCRVIGFDIDANKINAARSLGLEAYHTQEMEPVSFINSITDHHGADAVIITASAKQDTIINQSAAFTRKRGRIILIGVVDMHMDRNEFYKKEISFQVSCSYGPGRYDKQYEEEGIDYPFGLVRFTEKRNFETILQSISRQQLSVQPLITRRVNFEEAVSVYNALGNGADIATIINFSSSAAAHSFIQIPSKTKKTGTGIAIIGAGNFTRNTLLPALKNSGASLRFIASNDGLNATLLAKKFGIANAVTETELVLQSPEVDLVMIATRHDSHAALSIRALNAGKHVFTEKPVALQPEELDQLERCLQQHPESLFFTGFNRRFSPLSVKAKQLIGNAGDLNIIITVNAGALPADHWLHNMKTGGGRIIGEACHFFDLMSYFTGSAIETVYATDTGKGTGFENCIIQLQYKNGMHGVINYVANGSKAYPKEKIELFTNGGVLVIDNFIKLTGYGIPRFRSVRIRQNKGHAEQFNAIIKAVATGGEPVIPFTSILNTTKATFAAIKSIQDRSMIEVI